jgi:hypothetical protein
MYAAVDTAMKYIEQDYESISDRTRMMEPAEICTAMTDLWLE